MELWWKFVAKAVVKTGYHTILSNDSPQCLSEGTSHTILFTGTILFTILSSLPINTVYTDYSKGIQSFVSTVF